MTIIKAPVPIAEPTEIKAAPVHLSYSQITSLVPRYQYACARSWAYDKLLGVPWISSGALICGSSFDLGANTFFEGRMGLLSNVDMNDIDACRDAGIKASEVSLRALAETETFKIPLTKDQIAAYIEALRLALISFASYNRDVVPGTVQTRHEFTVNGRTVIGFSDRIDADGTIVDHKWSGSTHWDKNGNWDMDWLAPKRDQLVVYWLSRMAEYRRWLKAGDSPHMTPAERAEWKDPGVFGPPVEPAGKVVVIYMKAGAKTPQIKEISFEFTEEDRERVLHVVVEADAIAKSGVYPARPGDACKYCSSVDRCRRDSVRAEPLFGQLTGLPIAKEDK